MGDIRFHIKRYLDEGRIILPVLPLEKATRLADWPNASPTIDDFKEDFNVAERLDSIVDVDCDCEQSRLAASRLLLHTDRKHGRPSVGTTHYFFEAPGLKPEQFKDVDGSVLIEIRTGNQQYTLIPPSVLPRKDDTNETEALVWDRDGAPGKVDPAGLRDAVRLVATASLLARHWPKGSRHVVARDAAGFLASRDMAPNEVELVIRIAAELAGDNEVDDRAKAARDSADQFLKGGKTTGLPTLAASVGEDVVKRLRHWFGGTNESIVDELNASLFMVKVGSTAVVGDESDAEVIFSRDRDMALLFENQKVQVGSRPRANTAIYKTKYEIWKESPRRRTYRRVVFKPQPLACRESDYNLWKGFAIEPQPGSCQHFLTHTREIVCSSNDLHFEYLMDLLALTVQEPGKPSEIAVVLRGQQGTGKGVFVRYFGSLFGRHFIQVDKSEHITGKFNAQLSAKVVVFADEAVWAGDKRDVGPLKRLITEPTLTIERKGIDLVNEDNCVHLFMATNEKWSAPIGFHERRFFVLDVSNTKRQNFTYFQPLYHEQANGGREALLAFLLDRKVDRERLRKVPQTDALRVQQEYSMHTEERWWKDALKRGVVNAIEDAWPDWISSEDLYWSYLGWCEQMKINRRLEQSELVDRFQEFLKPVAAKLRRRVKRCTPRDEHGRRMLGETVQRRGWDVPSLAECRQAWDTFSGLETPWSTLEDSSVEENFGLTSENEEL